MSFEEWLPSLGCFRVLPPFFSRVDCECNQPSFLAIVFYQASNFNGNINQWDVAKVTTMNYSKSIHIMENNLT